MICEMRVKHIFLVRDLFIVSFFAEPACGGESLPTRTVLVVVVVPCVGKIYSKYTNHSAWKFEIDYHHSIVHASLSLDRIRSSSPLFTISYFGHWKTSIDDLHP